MGSSIDSKGLKAGVASSASASAKRESSASASSAPKRLKGGAAPGLAAMQLSEEVCLKGTHMLDSILSCETVQGMPPMSKLNSVLKSVADRLDERFVQIYAADYNSASSIGIATLEKLRGVHNLLLKCKPIVDGLSSKSETPLGTNQMIETALSLQEAVAPDRKLSKGFVLHLWRLAISDALGLVTASKPAVQTNEAVGDTVVVGEPGVKWALCFSLVPSLRVLPGALFEVLESEDCIPTSCRYLIYHIHS